MKSAVKFELKFEFLSEDDENRLIGGFSTSFANTSIDPTESGEANNCSGGNCVEGCQKNDSCNLVAGCGASGSFN